MRKMKRGRNVGTPYCCAILVSMCVVIAAVSGPCSPVTLIDSTGRYPADGLYKWIVTVDGIKTGHHRAST